MLKSFPHWRLFLTCTLYQCWGWYKISSSSLRRNQNLLRARSVNSPPEKIILLFWKWKFSINLGLLLTLRRFKNSQTWRLKPVTKLARSGWLKHNLEIKFGLNWNIVWSTCRSDSLHSNKNNSIYWKVNTWSTVDPLASHRWSNLQIEVRELDQGWACGASITTEAYILFNLQFSRQI